VTNAARGLPNRGGRGLTRPAPGRAVLRWFFFCWCFRRGSTAGRTTPMRYARPWAGMLLQARSERVFAGVGKPASQCRLFGRQIVTAERDNSVARRWHQKTCSALKSESFRSISNQTSTCGERGSRKQSATESAFARLETPPARNWAGARNGQNLEPGEEQARVKGSRKAEKRSDFRESGGLKRLPSIYPAPERSSFWTATFRHIAQLEPGAVWATDKNAAWRACASQPPRNPNPAAVSTKRPGQASRRTYGEALRPVMCGGGASRFRSSATSVRGSATGSVRPRPKMAAS